MDITARKLAEEERERSEARFRSLVQRAADMVTIVDAGGSVLYQSPAVERVLGYRPEELVGTSSFAFAHPDDLPVAQHVFVNLLTQPAPGASASFEGRFRHRDGSWRTLEVVATNLLDERASAASSSTRVMSRSAPHCLLS